MHHLHLESLVFNLEDSLCGNLATNFFGSDVKKSVDVLYKNARFVLVYCLITIYILNKFENQGLEHH